MFGLERFSAMFYDIFESPDGNCNNVTTIDGIRRMANSLEHAMDDLFLSFLVICSLRP